MPLMPMPMLKKLYDSWNYPDWVFGCTPEEFDQYLKLSEREDWGSLMEMDTVLRWIRWDGEGDPPEEFIYKGLRVVPVDEYGYLHLNTLALYVFQDDLYEKLTRPRSIFLVKSFDCFDKDKFVLSDMPRSIVTELPEDLFPDKPDSGE